MSDDIRQRIMVQAEAMSRHGFEGVEQVLRDSLDAIDAERAVVSLLEKSNDAKLEMWRQCESDLSATRKRLREAEEALRAIGEPNGPDEDGDMCCPQCGDLRVGCDATTVQCPGRIARAALTKLGG